VLGSGRSLSPGVSPLPKRNSSLLNATVSPSASSLSLDSSASTSQTSPENQDIASRISFDQNGSSSAAAAIAASSRLACPICNEEMVRLRRVETEQG
jgi:rabenosyn-5